MAEQESGLASWPKAHGLVRKSEEFLATHTDPLM